MKLKDLRIYIPSIALLAVWLAVYLVRSIPIIEFHPVGTNTHLHILLFILTGAIAGFFGGSFALINKKTTAPEYKKRTINRRATIIAFIGVSSSILALLKYQSLTEAMPTTIAEITELRLERGRDLHMEKGSNIFGVIANITSGFSILSYLYLKYFESQLSHRKRRLLLASFISGASSSLLSGGRWTIAIAILSILFSRFSKSSILKNCIPNPKKNKKRTRNRILKTVIATSTVTIVIYVFFSIFLHRAGDSSDGSHILVDYVSTNLDGTTVSSQSMEFASRNDLTASLFFICSMTQYYVGHSYYQLDILLNAPTPDNAPYYLAYQLYPYAMLLNKVGGNIISISQIQDEIVNPGFYFTLLGSCYLDFGYWGALLCISFGMFFGSFFWAKWTLSNRFEYQYLSFLTITVITISPILSAINTAVFPSLISIIPLLLFLTPRTFKQKELFR